MKQSGVVFAVFVAFLFFLIPQYGCGKKSPAPELKVQEENNNHNNEVKASREEKVRLVKDITRLGYIAGTNAISKQECYDVAKKAEKKFKETGDEWTNGLEILNRLAYDACVIGYLDSTDGEYSLPKLLAMIDIIAENQ